MREVAADGVEGLNLFKKHHPLLVITNIKMPQMDGLTMSQEIKYLAQKTQIIIMSKKAIEWFHKRYMGSNKLAQAWE